MSNITCDMCHGYHNAMAEAFPKAITTVDKFHVVRMINDTVDLIRRRENRSKDKKKTNALDKTRYLWLKNRDNLTQDQIEQLDILLNTEYLDTVTAYNLKLKLQGVYENCIDYESAVEAFEGLCLEMSNSRVRELQRVSKSLTCNAVELLNYFDSRKTNALLEGFNSVIGLIKRRVRGFKNMDNFIAMIYFVCGDLQFPINPIM